MQLKIADMPSVVEMPTWSPSLSVVDAQIFAGLFVFRVSERLCETKRQYLLTSQVSRYCLLALQSIFIMRSDHLCFRAARTLSRGEIWQNVALISSAIKSNREPSKQETLNQCWFNVGPESETMGQHYISIGSTSRVCWELARLSQSRGTRAPRTLY